MTIWKQGRSGATPSREQAKVTTEHNITCKTKVRRKNRLNSYFICFLENKCMYLNVISIPRFLLYIIIFIISSQAMQCRLVWTQQMTYVTFTLIPVLIFSLVYHTNMKVGFYTDFLSKQIFFKRRKYFFLKIFHLQDGYQNTIANMTTFNRRMTDQLKKSLQKVSLYELEGSERK